MKKTNKTASERIKALILWEKAAALYVVITKSKGFKIAINAAKFVWLLIKLFFIIIRIKK